MGWGKIRKSISKSIRKVTGNGLEGLVLAGKGGIMDKALREAGHGVGYLTGANAMADLAEAQAAANEAQIAQAQRQASIAAGNVQQTSEAGTENALSKLLKKRTALAKASPTLGQPRGNTTLG